MADTIYSNSFQEVQAEEIAWLNKSGCEGRERLAGMDRAATPAGATPEQRSISAPCAPVQGLGLACSGGGVRSAAFALGAVQALDQDLGCGGTGGIKRFHYLSSVSGGGYLAASLRLGLQFSGSFPFSSQAGDKSDTPAIGHIRNHSRYLIPNGTRDLISCIVVILRGLVVNLLLVLAALLVLAGLTGMFNPNQQAYSTPDIFGYEFPSLAKTMGQFAITKILLLGGLVFFPVWGLERSIPPKGSPEFRDVFHSLACLWLVVLLFTAFLELQPYAIRGLFNDYSDFSGQKTAPSGGAGSLGFLGDIATTISKYSPVFAALGTILAFIGRFFGDAVKTGGPEKGAPAAFKVVISKVAMLFVALALPLLIWVAYLHLALVTDIGFIHRPTWLAVAISTVCGAPDVSLLNVSQLSEIAPWAKMAVWGADGPTGQAPAALLATACQEPRLVGWLFVGAGVFLLALTWALRPNANSLHRLYRDRLSKAFLFKPVAVGATQPGVDPEECGDTALTAITGNTGPLPLINCALNVQGSKLVNRRGRNADFFFFSPVYSGSSATGFLRSDAPPRGKGVEIPDVGTAVAISGAAASSNMGANTVWGMAPTLALLNIRLGYWLNNPKHRSPDGQFLRSTWEKLRDGLKLYLVSEMFSQLDERAAQIYLTDGGHIENLGLYELLRRRVRTIVVIDAEADPGMTFGALVTAQRFARIDLGIRITLPWQAIREGSLKVGKAMGAGESIDVQEARLYPHVAVGTIDYGGVEGRLIYVKSSLSGDENDYIRAYKQRYPTFPHETTGDQFFSEEQLEAYRALGFHAVHSAFEGKTEIAGLTHATDAAVATQKSGTPSAFKDLFKPQDDSAPSPNGEIS
jgi:hypothetical protein